MIYGGAGDDTFVFDFYPESETRPGSTTIIDSGARGNIRIVDYKSHPFACIDYGAIHLQQ